MAGVSDGQFAQCQSNDRWGYVTRDIPDGRAGRLRKERPTTGKVFKAVTQKWEVLRRPEKNHDNSQVTLRPSSSGVSLINPNIAGWGREFKTETPSTRRFRRQALFTAVTRLPPHTHLVHRKQYQWRFLLRGYIIPTGNCPICEIN